MSDRLIQDALLDSSSGPSLPEVDCETDLAAWKNCLGCADLLVVVDVSHLPASE